MTRFAPALLTTLVLISATPVGAAAPAHFWSQRFGSTGGDQSSGLAITPTGDVIVVGSFEGTVDFGGGPLVSAGSSDIFVARYSPAGVHQWSKRFGGTSLDYATDVAVDSNGDTVEISDEARARAAEAGNAADIPSGTLSADRLTELRRRIVDRAHDTDLMADEVMRRIADNGDLW
jgi:hypothetical protein